FRFTSRVAGLPQNRWRLCAQGRRAQGLGAAMSGPRGEYSVWRFHLDGACKEVVVRSVDAKSAFAHAKEVMLSIGGQIGTTTRLIIIDGCDRIVFEWRFGAGATFPPRRQLQ